MIKMNSIFSDEKEIIKIKAIIKESFVDKNGRQTP
jgi:hypothetical protein